MILNMHFLFPKRLFILAVLLSVLQLAFTAGFGKSQTKDVKPSNSLPDFKVTESNTAFVEFEYFPKFTDTFLFQGKISETSRPGIPDVGLRSFPVILPAGANNRIEIIDARFEELSNADIKPVPRYVKDKIKNADIPLYEIDQSVYGRSSYYPESAARLLYSGLMRNKHIGYANLYPLQLNPSTGTIRKYSYIKVRITFAGQPVMSRKPLSGEEKSFLHGNGINWETAADWSSAEFENQSDLPVINSIFSSGDFFRIEVKETGIYKLDKNALRSAGVNVDNLNPRTLKIYGSNGSELAYDNSVNTPVDPVECRIFVSGEDDGVFNDNDHVLFFGSGPHDWSYDTLARTWLKRLNHFSNSNYYWLTYGGANGQRMNVTSSSGTGLQPIPYFTEKFFEEPEINNLGATGYLWVSQSISINQGFTFNRELKGYIDGTNVNVRFRFGNGSFFPENWRLEDLSAGYLVNQYVQALASTFTHIITTYLGDNRYGVSYPLNPGKRNIDFRASLPSANGNSSNVTGYYDFLEVLYKREFRAENNVLRFTSPDTSGNVKYLITGFTSNDVKVFDVTDHNAASVIIPEVLGAGTVSFEATNVLLQPKSYFAIGGNNYRTPNSISGKIANQNLKGQLAEGASFIIITPKEFVSAANRLKAHRESQGTDYLKTEVVEIDKIFNEFSSGIEDPVAVRNFLKYGYFNWTERPVYVLFFGDGSYDYKNIYSLYNSNLKNWVPPIQKNSEFADDVDSYCSDDFMVEFTENYTAPGGLAVVDMATGRFCVNNLEEANNVIDKVISYENPANFRKWRTEVMYVADDGWTTENTSGEEGSLHTDQCEDVSENHSPGYILKDKVYIVTYPSEITPQGRRKPGVNSDIIRKWNEGRLVVNYTGHGSTDLWAHEHVFVRQTSIPQLNNKDKYPFVTIASCDLARWDDPFNISAAEQLVFIRDKGAVGISAAVRPVYSIPNAIYNNKLYDNLFRHDTLNLRLRLGKAIYNVKQELYFDNDLKFALIGDPSMRLGLPQYRTRIDSINNVPGGSLFEMKALQKVKISGSVLRNDSTFWNDFNGELDIKVLDVDKNIIYLDFGYQFNFKQPGGSIYSGKTQVSDGKWNVEFVVPRDISYNPGRGKMIIYFNNSSVDGLGFSDNFIMNGIDSTAAADTTGPNISIYLDSRNFRTGDLVNQNPKLIVDFFDENGLNLTGSIGHKIEAILNDNENEKIDLTQLYTSASGYQNGTLEYSLANLPEGNNKLEIRAWDTYNNFGTKLIDFKVQNTSDLVLEEIYNYPNPMKDQTSFVFQHNFNESLEARILIYTTAGRLIKELNKSNITDKFVSIDWDGKDNDGDYIANGTYIYKINIKTESGGFAQNSTGKLVVLK